jgi:hypothetical protein
MVYVPDIRYSVEIKTSSDPKQVFGNRSYAQPSAAVGKKGKSGYYLTVNFQEFTATITHPQVLRISFGWLDHSDWIPQAAPTGQRAHINPAARQFKLVRLYP